MATSTIKQMKDYSNPKALSFAEGVTTDGRYYKFKIKTVNHERFVMLLIRNSQSKAFAPMGAVVNYLNGVLHNIYFSDASATFDLSSMTITIDEGVAAWGKPMIIYPKDFIEFE